MAAAAAAAGGSLGRTERVALSSMLLSVVAADAAAHGETMTMLLKTMLLKFKSKTRSLKVEAVWTLCSMFALANKCYKQIIIIMIIIYVVDLTRGAILSFRSHLQSESTPVSLQLFFTFTVSPKLTASL